MCKRQEGGGAQAHKFHTTPWGLPREEGMTGAEEIYEVFCQIIPVELESWPSGQSSQRVHSIIVKISSDTLFMKKNQTR